MNKTQNNVHRMATATLKLMADNDEIVAPFSVITEQRQKIETILKEIELHKDGQELGDTTAKTKAKNELLDELVQRTAKLARKASGLAKMTGDNELLSKVDLYTYKITDGSDQDTLDTVQRILEAAKEDEAVLVNGYNLAEGEIAALEDTAARVDELIDERKVDTSSGKASTSSLLELISELRLAWDTMDDLVEGIIDDEDFIDTYNNTRRIGN